MRFWAAALVILLGTIVQVQPARAAAPPLLAGPGGLVLIEIKITGNEFVMLQNNTGSMITDLSKYWLYDFNNVNPLAAGVSSSSQQLPQASLADGQTVLLNSVGGQTCGAAVTAKLSISLTDSGGFLEIIQSNLVNGVLQQTAGDAVSWSSGTNSAAGMISGVPSSSADPAAAYYRYQNASASPPYLWQLSDVDGVNSCQLNVKIAGAVTPGPSNPGRQLVAGAPPPAVFIEADDSSAGPSIPPSDIGLAAPIVNELLPNPAEPQSDDEDEFIELYNPNDKVFDLTGFKLEVGSRTLHDHTLPAGTSLPPKSFTALYSIDTNLSLSNTSGQAKLLDPFGNIIGQSDVYNTAKEGQTWALANGAWYWTTSPTPNAANVIKLPKPPVKSKTSSKKGSAATAKIKTASSSNTSGSQPGSFSQPPPAPSGGLHAGILAGIGGLALLYALYEYRHDLGNRLYQLRRYREARRAARQVS